MRTKCRRSRGEEPNPSAAHHGPSIGARHQPCSDQGIVHSLAFQVLGRLTAVLWACFSISALTLRAADAPALHAPATNTVARILYWSGTVDVAPAGRESWTPARREQLLSAGDRVRTALESRATIQLSDRSVVRLGPSSLLEIQAPRHPPARSRFWLRIGRLFFLNREAPSDIEFETPLAAGAIRGTEFILFVNASANLLALLDGAVTLTAGNQSLNLERGEQANLAPGRPMSKTQLVQVPNLVQWSLYYPAVLNLDELPLTPAERQSLAPSLQAWALGDAAGAVRAWPGPPPSTDGSRLLRAALDLAVGDVEHAESLLAQTSSAPALVAALRELIAAVTLQDWSATTPDSSSAWLAHSYWLQSRSDLAGARAAAQRALQLKPDFAFAWTRLAELEFSFANRASARRALAKAEVLAPRDARSHALRGFVLLADRQVLAAQQAFDRAVDLDEAMADAWLGRALCQEHRGHAEQARQWLQVAAALEPRRSLLRSYLGKGFAQAGDSTRATKELRLAQELDPRDPTPWLYSALLRHQQSQVNQAIRDLDRAVLLNDHRSLFRSRFLLDQDRSVASADLAALYADAGIREPAMRSAERAVTYDYGNFSGHLFLANSYQALEDLNRFDLRWETARQSELLLANLLAPPGAGNLSQQLSQQEHLRYFDLRPFGVSSFTEYRSSGDWEQAASFYGAARNFSYAVDAQYRSLHGQRPNADLEHTRFSVQTKTQITPADGAYLQAAWFEGRSGDVARHYHPSDADLDFRVKERQVPALHLGWDHQWSPQHRTLLLASYLTDDLQIQDANRPLLFLRQAGGAISQVELGGRATFDLSYQNRFDLGSIELQHLWQTDRQGLIAGARYQHGESSSDAVLFRVFPPPLSDQHAHGHLDRVSTYAYYRLRPWDPLWLNVGLTYDRIDFPANLDLPPLLEEQEQRHRLSPKASLSLQLWDRGFLSAQYSQALGGLYFDDSLRLEPTQLAGFIQSPRSLIPESVAGLVPGTRFETWGLGFDQSFGTGTFLGVTGEVRSSEGERSVGAVSNSLPIPLPDTPFSLSQRLHFREREVRPYFSQLLGRDWAFSAEYSLSDAQLETAFPDLPDQVAGLSELQADHRATLHHASLSLHFNHPSRFFAIWQSEWFHQQNRDDSFGRTGDDFWQHHLVTGYRFPRRHAEWRIGILNLTGQDYRLDPLNYARDLPRGRTLMTSLRLSF